MDINVLLELSVKNHASDLHLSAGLPPMMRIDGEIYRSDLPVLESRTLNDLIATTMSEVDSERYREHWDVDFSFSLRGLMRFRVNAFHQIRGPGAVFRVIPPHIPDLEELKAPFICKELAELPSGLVLITGPSGSGKSTTLASMVNYRNSRQSGHILTIEDPVEFIYKSQRSLVNQREVYRDTSSFSSALRAALRGDPDVILIGEMRDLETIRLALSAAETGHLVLATLHTSSAAKAANRIVDVFPAKEKDLIRTLLAESLQAVIAQCLLKKKGGGRVAAHEIMLGTTAIRHLIRENKTAQIPSVIQTGQALGMKTLEQDLERLVREGVISRERVQKSRSSIHGLANS